MDPISAPPIPSNPPARPNASIQTPVSTPEYNKHRQLPLLAAILSLLVLSIIAALAYQNFILRKQLSLVTPISPPPTGGSPTSAPDPTSSWKTYTNTSYNFSVKYPSNLLESCNPSPTVDGIRFWKMPWNCPEAHDAPYTIAINGYDKNIYRKFIANRTNTPISSKVITIAGIDSTQNLYKYTNEDGPLANFQESTEIIIPVGINVIVIQQFGNSLEDKSLFDQILSTFQFLN